MVGLSPEFDFDRRGPYSPAWCSFEIQSTRLERPVFLDRDDKKLVVWTREDVGAHKWTRRFQLWGTEQTVNEGLVYQGTWLVGVHHLHLWEVIE